MQVPLGAQVHSGAVHLQRRPGVEGLHRHEEAPQLRGVDAIGPWRSTAVSGRHKPALLVVGCERPTLPSAEAIQVGLTVETGPVDIAVNLRRLRARRHDPLERLPVKRWVKQVRAVVKEQCRG